MRDNALLRLLFPPRCAFCGKWLGEGEKEVCAACMADIRFLTPAQQPAAPPYIDGVAAALRYEKTVRTAVHRLKFRAARSVAAPFGRLVAHQTGALLGGPFDIVTWVPTNDANLRRRGYDHARMIAEETAGRLGVPCAALLRKTRKTQAMYGLTPSQRKANILDAFCVKKGTEVSGLRILLIDDVLTTGATLSECARTLREEGAASVSAAVLAAAKKPDKRQI